jgi:hypothetical protein
MIPVQWSVIWAWMQEFVKNSRKIYRSKRKLRCLSICLLISEPTLLSAGVKLNTFPQSHGILIIKVQVVIHVSRSSSDLQASITIPILQRWLNFENKFKSQKIICTSAGWKFFIVETRFNKNTEKQNMLILSVKVPKLFLKLLNVVI